MKYFLYNKNTGIYEGDGFAEIDRAKTVAIKRTVFKKPVPKNATFEVPPAQKGKCRFLNGKWIKIEVDNDEIGGANTESETGSAKKVKRKRLP